MKTVLLSALLGATMALQPAANAKVQPKEPNCETGLPASKYSERSLYRLRSEWTADNGKIRRLDSFRGQPVVLALFFSNCQHSCPFVVKDMKEMQKKLSARAAERVNFVLVSIDPDRDSVEALNAFRQKHHLTGERWTLLRGDAGDVKELADRVGFQYYAGSRTQFAHSILITVLNPAGEIVHQQAGLGVDRKGAIATLEKGVVVKAAK